MLKIGITGGIGSGKTTVCKLFSLLSIPIYFADDEAKRLMVQNPLLIHQIIELFGPEIYKDGHMDRQLLANIVFNNMDKLKALNNLVHPAVHKDFHAWTEKFSKAPYVLEEAALIFESGGNQWMDKMILVTASIETRIERVMKRNHLSEMEVRARMDKQWSDEKKLPLCDFVIINDGKASLIRQVLEVHSVLTNEFV